MYANLMHGPFLPRPPKFNNTLYSLAAEAAVVNVARSYTVCEYICVFSRKKRRCFRHQGIYAAHIAARYLSFSQEADTLLLTRSRYSSSWSRVIFNEYRFFSEA